MTAFTIQDVSRRSGLSGPTLRYYEEVGLVGPIDRDASSGHRRYRSEDVDVLQALACLRELGVGIEDMRTYQANRARGHAAAAEQRDPLLRHAGRVVTKTMILEHIWDYSFDPQTNVVDVLVCRLRNKIDRGRKLVHTIRGVGYVLKPD